MSQSVIDFLSRPELLAAGLGVVAFLTLFWTVRGAPIGQRAATEPSEAPSPGYRDRAVAIAVLSILIVAAGAVVAAAYGSLASLPVFAAGFALNLWVTGVNRKYRHVSTTMRRLIEFSNAAMACSLVGGILVVADVFAFKYGGRPIDFTRDAAFTLSSLSRNQVEAIERPLKITLVLGRSDASGRARDRVRQLVDLYKGANPTKVSVREITPFSQTKAAEYDDLIKRAPEVGVVQGDAIVLEYGEGAADRAVLSVPEMFKLDRPGGRDTPTYESAFTGEDAVTSAIARFREGKRSRVGFTTGHGEPSIADLDPRQPGLGLWKERLVSVGSDAVDLNLVSADVPADLSLLVIVAPRSRFQDQEVARIRAYIEAGGPVLAILGGLQKSGLEDLLALHNVAIDPGVVVDPTSNVSRQSNLVVCPPIRGGEHAIVDTLVGQSILIPNASPLRIIGEGALKPGEPRPTVNPGIIVYPILKTGPSSWVETDLTSNSPAFDASTDRPGPALVAVAAAARPELPGGKPRPRMVVVSSPFLASNPYLEIDPSNLDLAMNAVQWLRGRDGSLGVAPKVHTGMLFTADPNLRVRLHLVPTVLSVALILGFGITVYLARRS